MAKQKAHTVSGPRLLACLEQIYAALKGKYFYKQFDEYIGESAALLMEAETVDEWGYTRNNQGQT